MTGSCRWVFFGFLLLYLAALFLLAVGTFGLLGSPRGPLAGVFLMPLGLPWILLIDFAPRALHPWFAAGAPLVNLLAIRLICRARLSRRPTRNGA
jgi:4-amino-4-deoxy-L-arabinose transferase-like glycosyltransferase